MTGKYNILGSGIQISYGSEGSGNNRKADWENENGEKQWGAGGGFAR